VSVCPACGINVRPIWPSCRSCGALLMAIPAPLAPAGATRAGTATASGAGAAAVAAPSAAEQFFAPTVLQPIAQLPPTFAHAHAHASTTSTESARKWFVLFGMVAFMVAAVATAWFTLRSSSGAQRQTPVVLAPAVPAAGLPSGLGAVVRMQAESTRRTAVQALEEVGSGDLTALAAMQPSFTWLAGNQPSTDSHVVSVAQSAGIVTIAVAASNHDVCAFARWSPGASPLYVTMAHEPSCAAVDAPGTGWSNEAGGAASDLPDANG
jgi:hypothetical protein